MNLQEIENKAEAVPSAADDGKTSNRDLQMIDIKEAFEETV